MKAWVRLAVSLTLAAMALGFAPTALAGLRAGAGVADEVDGDQALVATVSWVGREQRIPWEVMVGYIGPRDIEDNDETVFGAVSGRLTHKRWFLSGGIAWTSVDNDVLSGHVQLMTAVGWDSQRFSVSLRHLSNAGTNGRNRGETFLLVEVEF